MNYRRFLISIVLPQLAGLFGSVFTFSAVKNWYAFLEKPAFSPPNWIFGPVWVLLYFLMGVSAYLIWQKSDRDIRAKKILPVFWLHLIFNSLWSFIFFGLHNIFLAFLEIVFLWFLILVLITKFRKIERVSAYLLIPYLFWVSFAVILNYSIFILN